MKPIVFVWLLGMAANAHADLVGLWQEYDDDTGKLAALIRITQRADGAYDGIIEKIVEKPRDNKELLCKRCSGELHNRSLLGLRILSDMKRKDELHYDGGEVLDPDDGKVYKCRIQLSNDQETLQVTGFINFSWIGQSEIWRRAKE